MEEFLQKIGLLQRYTLSLPVEQSRFVHLLENAVDSEEFELFEAFSASQNKFKGQVDIDGFNMRRRKTFWNSKRVFSRAKGIFRSENNKLRIDIEINGLNWAIKVFYIVVPCIYLSFLTTILTDLQDLPLFAIIFILFHALLMLGIPYLNIRYSIKRLKEEIEREFFYMIRDK